jgi:hypothetical protein
LRDLFWAPVRRETRREKNEEGRREEERGRERRRGEERRRGREWKRVEQREEEGGRGGRKEGEGTKEFTNLVYQVRNVFFFLPPNRKL